MTPFDGISAKLASPPDYAIGQYSHKMLPLLGLSVKSLRGKPGMTMTAYTEHPDDKAERKPVDTVEIDKTELLLVDYYNPKITSRTWYADFEGSFVADEDCTWELSLVVVGTAKLFCNGQLVVDNDSKQTAGDTFFNQGTVEEKGRLRVRKGETYAFKVQFGSAATSKLRGGQVLFGSGALRIGGCKVIDPRAEIERAAALARTADQVIVCAGLNADWETEGSDRADMDLPPGIDALVEAVAAANGNTVVVNQSGTPVAMPWARKVGAVVQAWYGGNETGNAIADVLFGDHNPSGKLSLSWPVRVQDNPAFLNFRTEGGRTIYGEDVYVGYRYYEFAGRDVLFPFGHGLSYTTFAFEEAPRVVESGGRITVAVQVMNTGKVAGADVVQVYIAPRQKAKVNRPVKELQGFAKVELAPGETREVEVVMETKYAASYFDEERGQWCVEKGEYDVVVSDSSDVKNSQAVTGSFEVPETYWWSGI